MKFKKITSKIIICIFIFLLVVFFLALIPLEQITTDYQGICCNCLQYAYIVEKKLDGITYSKKVTLLSYPNEGISSSIFNSDISLIDPSLYEKIFNKKCIHYFKKGSCGTSGFRYVFPFRRIDYCIGDGTFFDIDLSYTRLNSISSIYRLYNLTGNKEQAKLSYQIIDGLHPPSEMMPKDPNILNEFNIQLKQVDSEEKWKEINNKFKQLSSRFP